MVQKVLDPIISWYGEDVLGRQVCNFIGEYMKEQIAVVSTGSFDDPLLPYIGKIKTAVYNWSETLENEYYERSIKTAIADLETGLSVLISTLETLFTSTQTSASALYKLTPGIVPPFNPGTLYSSALIPALREIPPYYFCYAWDTFMVASYAAYGLN